ncbi:hypothetical protein IE077_001373, partial [Cardiosporidium cionae]
SPVFTPRKSQCFHSSAHPSTRETVDVPSRASPTATSPPLACVQQVAFLLLHMSTISSHSCDLEETASKTPPSLYEEDPPEKHSSDISSVLSETLSSSWIPTDSASEDTPNASSFIEGYLSSPTRPPQAQEEQTYEQGEKKEPEAVIDSKIPPFFPTMDEFKVWWRSSSLQKEYPPPAVATKAVASTRGPRKRGYGFVDGTHEKDLQAFQRSLWNRQSIPLVCARAISASSTALTAYTENMRETGSEASSNVRVSSNIYLSNSVYSTQNLSETKRSSSKTQITQRSTTASPPMAISTRDTEAYSVRSHVQDLQSSEWMYSWGSPSRRLLMNTNLHSTSLQSLFHDLSLVWMFPGEDVCGDISLEGTPSTSPAYTETLSLLVYLCTLPGTKPSFEATARMRSPLPSPPERHRGASTVVASSGGASVAVDVPHLLVQAARLWKSLLKNVFHAQELRTTLSLSILAPSLFPILVPVITQVPTVPLSAVFHSHLLKKSEDGVSAPLTLFPASHPLQHPEACLNEASVFESPLLKYTLCCALLPYARRFLFHRHPHAYEALLAQEGLVFCRRLRDLKVWIVSRLSLCYALTVRQGQSACLPVTAFLDCYTPVTLEGTGYIHASRLRFPASPTISSGELNVAREAANSSECVTRLSPTVYPCLLKDKRGQGKEKRKAESSGEGMAHPLNLLIVLPSEDAIRHFLEDEFHPMAAEEAQGVSSQETNACDPFSYPKHGLPQLPKDFFQQFALLFYLEDTGNAEIMYGLLQEGADETEIEAFISGTQAMRSIKGDSSATHLMHRYTAAFSSQGGLDVDVEAALLMATFFPTVDLLSTLQAALGEPLSPLLSTEAVSQLLTLHYLPPRCILRMTDRFTGFACECLYVHTGLALPSSLLKQSDVWVIAATSSCLRQRWFSSTYTVLKKWHFHAFSFIPSSQETVCGQNPLENSKGGSTEGRHSFSPRRDLTEAMDAAHETSSSLSSDEEEEETKEAVEGQSPRRISTQCEKAAISEKTEEEASKAAFDPSKISLAASGEVKESPIYRLPNTFDVEELAVSKRLRKEGMLLGRKYNASNASQSTIDRDQQTGKWGEAFVYEYLKNMYDSEINKGTAKVKWMNEGIESKECYDVIVEIKYSENQWETYYIEVKSSLSTQKHIFEISYSEWRMAQLKGMYYHIYRLIGIGTENIKLTRIVNPYRQWKEKQIGLCLAL